MKDLYRKIGISFVFIIAVASVLAIFEIDDKPKRKKKRLSTPRQTNEEKMSSSTAALLVSAPSTQIGKPDATKILPDRSDQAYSEPEYLPENNNTSENINEKYFRMKFIEPTPTYPTAPLQDAPEINQDQQDITTTYSSRNQDQSEIEQLRETIETLQNEIEKHMNYANTERQARVFTENQLKAESRLRVEAEDILRLQSAEYEKQKHTLETSLQNERRKGQMLEEKLHILQAEITYLRTKGMDNNNESASSEVNY